MRRFSSLFLRKNGWYSMYNEPSYTDSIRCDVNPSYRDSIAHKGVKGMKWGYNFGSSNGKRRATEEDIDENDPRKTSNIPDDGRKVNNFKDLWYDSENYVRVGGHKVTKNESGEASINVGRKIVTDMDLNKAVAKATKLSNRYRRQMDRV